MLDKLETLNQANLLLDTGNLSKQARLGLKPRLSSEAFRAALERRLIERVQNANLREREIPVVDLSEPISEPALQPVSKTVPEAIPEPVLESPSPAISAKPSSAQPWWILFSLALLLTLGFLAYQWWGQSLSRIDPSQTVFISDEKRELIITSGIYAKRSEAKQIQEELERITGDQVKILKRANFYTVQIGDSFENTEDAYLFFDELLKYPIKELSIIGI